MEISDLNASLQEKVLVITDLKDDLRKLKGKALVDNDVNKNTSELLTHINKTCPSVNNTDEKLVAVTPKNKDKRVRFTKPVTSSGYTITKIASTSNLVSNKPMLSSTGVKPSTSASGSQPSGNTKKDKNRHGLVRGLPKLKLKKDHLCSACAMGKSKKKPHKPKSEDTNQEKLYLLHMDLYRPMRVASDNGKKYIIVIIDDYSGFT
ncbi:hypothetical protein Tco_0811717 [Tanacetum coccineum]